MTATEKFIYRNLAPLRRIVQITALLFIIAVPFLNRLGYKQIIGTYYSLSIGNLEVVDPAIMMQTVLLTKQFYIPLLLAAVVPILIAFFLGKVFCGWICPFNFLAEFTDRVRKKLRPRTVRVRNTNPFPYTYWLIFMSVFLILLVSGVPIVTHISMPGLLSAQLADLIFSGTLGLEILLVILILLLEIFTVPRFWCKYICPVGATLALFRSPHALKIKFTTSKCTCSAGNFLECHSACPLHLDPRNPGIYPYCFNCGACVDACRRNGQALLFSFRDDEKATPTAQEPQTT